MLGGLGICDLGFWNSRPPVTENCESVEPCRGGERVTGNGQPSEVRL
jgi:hypothetical protein